MTRTSGPTSSIATSPTSPVSLDLPLAAGTGLPALGLYLFTLSRGAGWGDASELALAGFRFGLTHPPGAPAFVVLAWIATRFGAEPALATNLLSASCTAAAAACVALCTSTLTRDRLASAVAGLTFAAIHPIWMNAVTTELYPLSALALAVTVLMALRGHARRAGLAMAFALGAYLPNALLFLPAWWLSARRSSSRAARWTFPAAAVFGMSLWIALDIFLGRRHPPLGSEVVPDSPAHLLRFLVAAQYTAHPPREVAFYLHRLVEHTAQITRYLLGVGLVPALAGVASWRRQGVAGPLGAWLLLGFGYFTFHPYSDYALMPHAGYLALCLGVGCGIQGLRHAARPAALRVLGTGATVIPLLLVAVQLGGFRARAGRNEPAEFVANSFATLPRDAVVFARWERFTALLYAQQVHHRRPDLLLLERQDRPRRYSGFVVDGWRDHAEELQGERPAIVDVESGSGADSTLRADSLRSVAGTVLPAGDGAAVRWAEWVGRR